MVSSISIEWSACYLGVVSSNGGWSQLVNVPVAHVSGALLRLQAIGASNVSLVELNTIQFQIKRSQAKLLCQLFPCCPLSSKLS